MTSLLFILYITDILGNKTNEVIVVIYSNIGVRHH